MDGFSYKEIPDKILEIYSIAHNCRNLFKQSLNHKLYDAAF